MSQYYRNINELPLSRFIDIVVDGTLAPLIKEGKPSDKELMEAWSYILTQYTDMVGGPMQSRLLQAYKELTKNQIRYSQILMLINTLKIYYVKEFADLLHKLSDCRFPLNPENKEEYDNSLDRIKKRSASLRIKIDLKKAEIEQLEGFIGNTGKYSREYFDRVIIDLSDHAGFMLKEEDLTVYQFGIRINKMNAYYKSLKDNNDGRGLNKRLH